MNIPFRRSSLVALVLYSIAAIVNYDYRREKRIEKKHLTSIKSGSCLYFVARCISGTKGWCMENSFFLT